MLYQTFFNSYIAENFVSTSYTVIDIGVAFF